MTDERIIAYLLGELPDEESERFEDECFAEEDWPAQLNLVEEDLIDDYLRDELAPEQRLRFERNYLTTDARLERVRMAAALLRHVDNERAAAAKKAAAEPPTVPTWGERLRAFWGGQTWATRAAAALSVLALVVGAWWLVRPPSPQTIATLTLTASQGDRAEGVPPGRVKLTGEHDALKIFLTLPEGSAQAAGYRGELTDDSGEAKTLSVTASDARSVSVLIPAAQLPRGRYALKLFALKPDGTDQRISGSYRFNVE